MNKQQQKTNGVSTESNKELNMEDMSDAGDRYERMAWEERAHLKQLEREDEQIDALLEVILLRATLAVSQRRGREKTWFIGQLFGGLMFLALAALLWRWLLD